MRSLLAAAIVVLTAVPAAAQDHASGRGDGFFALMFPSNVTTFGFAGGGDAHVFKNLGLGAEAGMLTPSLFHVAPYATVHLPITNSGAVPFVSLSYVLARDGDQAEGYFGPGVGGGFEFWYRPNKKGVRVELAYLTLGRGGSSDSGWVARVGWTFR